MAARQSAPVIGAICNAGSGSEQGGALSSSAPPTGGRWQLSFGYRWQDSFRHFVGDVEQHERAEQHTFIENKIHLFDVALSYRVTPRWSLSFSAPIMKADRISHRTHAVTHSTGLGDISLGARAWVFRPPTESRQNIQLGFSIKLPTGKPDVANTTGTGAAATTRNVDQSIQLGDAGVGFSVDYMAYKSIRRFTVFSTGVYLFSPRNTNGVLTGRGRASEAIMSVPDQYLWRTGVGYAVPKLAGLAFTVAGRVEGLPARDIIGREDGFRRPGYVVSVEPGIQFARGRDSWSLSAPIAVRRDRTRSISDIRDGRHGDAAFADYLITVGYSRSF